MLSPLSEESEAMANKPKISQSKSVVTSKTIPHKVKGAVDTSDYLECQISSEIKKQNSDLKM